MAVHERKIAGEPDRRGNLSSPTGTMQSTCPTEELGRSSGKSRIIMIGVDRIGRKGVSNAWIREISDRFLAPRFLSPGKSKKAIHPRVFRERELWQVRFPREGKPISEGVEHDQDEEHPGRLCRVRGDRT